jgi:hypothetical protein
VPLHDLQIELHIERRRGAGFHCVLVPLPVGKNLGREQVFSRLPGGGLQRIVLPFDQVHHLARFVVRFFREDLFHGILCVLVTNFGRFD